MDGTESRSHWNTVYETRAPTELSWYQTRPERSLDLIHRTGAGPRTAIIDVGGGDSTLVDALLDDGMERVTVLDISAAALYRARRRLGSRSANVHWVEADVTHAELDPLAYDVWHDRAVFHFLTDPAARQRYVDVAKAALAAGGHAIVATFGTEGPTRCSGLDVVRYSPAALHAEFGDGFDLVEGSEERHRTPTGKEQHFIYCLLRKR